MAHIVKDKMPWLWDLVSLLNSQFFQMRYGKRLSFFEHDFLADRDCVGYNVISIRDVDADEMVDFFTRQPIEAYRFFKPHGFDSLSIRKLQKDRAFWAYVLKDAANGKIVGYCFNRSFFHGKGFRGRMVDIDYRGKGLGTMMNRLLNEVGFGIGLRLFETVSKENIASYRSAISASAFKVVEELPHNELYLEIINEMKSKKEMNKNVIGGAKTSVVRLQSLFSASINIKQERRVA